jgi:hypothetical protein
MPRHGHPPRPIAAVLPQVLERYGLNLSGRVLQTSDIVAARRITADRPAVAAG